MRESGIIRLPVPYVPRTIQSNRSRSYSSPFLSPLPPETRLHNTHSSPSRAVGANASESRRRNGLGGSPQSCRLIRYAPGRTSEPSGRRRQSAGGTNTPGLGSDHGGDPLSRSNVEAPRAAQSGPRLGCPGADRGPWIRVKGGGSPSPPPALRGPAAPPPA